MNCSICTFRYNQNRKPIGLGCGHTFCSQCISTDLSIKCKKCNKISKSFLNKDLYEIVANQRHQNIDKFVKVCFFGQSQVGKSSLLKRIADDEFNYNSIPTIGIDFKFKEYLINGKNIRFQLWDSAGQQRLRSITPHHYKNSDILFIVYDLTKHSNFNRLDYWLKEVQNYIQNNNIIVVGNKRDLEQKDYKVQPIAKADKQFIISKGWKMIQVSCKDGYGISQVVEMMKIMAIQVKKNSQQNQKYKPIINQSSLIQKSKINQVNSQTNSFWRCPQWCNIM